MRGIGGRPYISLDPFLDVSRIREIHAELIASYRSEMMTPVKYVVGNLYVRNGRLVEPFYAEHPDEIARFDRNSLVSWDQFETGWEVKLRAINDYHAKHLDAASEPTRWCDVFPVLSAFVEDLPLIEFGRITVFVNEPHKRGLVHSDFAYPPFNEVARTPHRTCFIWFRTDFSKNFFVINDATDEKIHVEGYSALFNSDDYHGSEASETLSFSVRVDGVFTPEFEERIGVAHLTQW